MKRTLRVLFAVLFIGFSLASLHALDFGMITNGELDVIGADKTDVSGKITLGPWLSVPLNFGPGEGEFYFSPGLYMNLAEKSIIAPELFRLEFSYRPSRIFSFRAGRFSWAEPTRLAARGRFDGAELLFNFGKVRLSLSALYTGLLFKDTSDISVSPSDTKDYNAPFEWSNFADSYFAPRRLLATLYGEFPGFPSGRGRLYAGVMGQFDLSGADEKFNTQYLLLRHSLVYKVFDLSLAGVFELENTEAGGLKTAFALALDAGWQLPGKIVDRLSLGFTWASGDASTAAFFPVVREPQSFVLKPVLSGMMAIKATYEARLLPSLAAELGALYFIRTDSTTFSAPYLENDSYALGAEIDARLLWVPFSDLSFTLKGGIFIPKTGAAWADDAPVRWRINAGITFSI